MIKYIFKRSLPLLMLIFSSLFFADNGQAANYPLEITNIKPAETGSPAIPKTNRIFRAYPGIEYNIRPAVFGGLYPFTFNLTQAPEGMTIDSTSGEISWPNPTVAGSPHSATVRVTDAEGTTRTASWAINVTTDGFLFIDDSYYGTETGSINQPFSSIANLLNNTSSANVNDIVYLRGGNYQFIVFNATDKMNLANRPFRWVGFPGEAVNINADHVFMYDASTGVYLDNLNIHNMDRYGVQTIGYAHYTTIRRCTFTDITNSNTTSNENEGFIMTNKGGQGYYMVIQDNSFSDNHGTDGIGSLYSGSKVVIEDNHIFNGNYSGGRNWVTAIGLKVSMQYVSLRHNTIDMPSDSIRAAVEFYGGTSDMTNHIDISFNLFARRNYSGQRNAAAIFFGKYMNNTHIYRNTFIGDIVIRDMDPSNCGNSGPISLYNNVIINPGTSYSEHNVYDFISFYSYESSPAHADARSCMTISSNLKGTAADNIVDANGNLTSDYSSYLGKAGWQTTNEATAITGLKAPTGLRLIY